MNNRTRTLSTNNAYVCATIFYEAERTSNLNHVLQKQQYRGELKKKRGPQYEAGVRSKRGPEEGEGTFFVVFITYELCCIIVYDNQ